MRATLELTSRAAYADYLAVEQTSEARHEFLDGVIVADEVYDDILDLNGRSLLR